MTARVDAVARKVSTYAQLRVAWEARTRLHVRSIHFHRTRSCFSNLYMPKRAGGRTSNGGFMMAPRSATS